LTDVNELFLRALMARLGVTTRIVRDDAFAPQGRRTERLLDICRKVGATHYLSGPSARDYLDEASFRSAGIGVEWMEYGPYPPYRQAGPVFDPFVSAVDLLFVLGAAAGDYCRPIWDIEPPERP